MSINLRKIGILLLMLLGVALSGCGNKIDNTVNTQSEIKEQNTEKSEMQYPKIVYIDNISYYGTDEKCEAVPRKAPDGIIETFVAQEIMPDAYNSANFGSELGQMEYMILEDDRLIVHMGEDWYYFQKQDKQNDSVK